MRYSAIEHTINELNKALHLKIEVYTFLSIIAFSMTELATRIFGRLDSNRLDNLIIIEVVFTILFILMVTFDIITGILASKARMSKLSNPPDTYIKSYKGFRSLWKILGVLLISFMVMFLAFITILLEQDIFYIMGLWLVIFMWFIACGLEYQSIGENLKEMYGTKPSFFNFFDKLFGTIERSGLKAIENKISNGNNYYESTENHNYDNDSEIQ